jgi:hypothetical protein
MKTTSLPGPMMPPMPKAAAPQQAAQPAFSGRVASSPADRASFSQSGAAGGGQSTEKSSAVAPKFGCAPCLPALATIGCCAAVPIVGCVGAALAVKALVIAPAVFLGGALIHGLGAAGAAALGLLGS